MKIVVLAGGISTERDVSLVSGAQIYKALKKNGHNAILLDLFLGYQGNPKNVFDIDTDWAREVTSVSEKNCNLDEIRAMRDDKSDALFGKNVIEICQMADIVFLGLHGDVGENGKLQAAFDLFGIKYTGTDYLSSACAMDKHLTKQIFSQNGVNTPLCYMLKGDGNDRKPKFPCVVKVCNGGSSVGVYIANNEKEYEDAVEDAFRYENTVMVEEYIKGREFTCCVIEGRALPIVEIEPVSGFYDYKNKYQAGSTIETCPANADEKLTNAVKKISLDAYNALGITTYARMDVLADSEGNVYCLEANTLPGMTPTSLIPQEAAAEGMSFEELCEHIIEISLKKYN